MAGSSRIWWTPSTAGRPRRPGGRDDEERLSKAIITHAQDYGRYGCRPITALLRDDGWRVNVKRVHRIWRREGLKVPRQQPR